MMNAEKSHRTTLWCCLVIFLLMEIPVRLLVQPDPWLLNPDHWYFTQPLRFLLELGLIAVLLLVIRQALPQLLVLERKHLALLVLGSAGSIVLFGFLEFDQLKASFNVAAPRWLLWFLTGFCIGVGQELLYRGLLFTSLARLMPVKLAALSTTVLFIVAPLHSVRLVELSSNGHITTVLLLIAVYFAASSFFQWLRERTGNVIVPGVVHGLGNAITWVAVFS
ncbi:CPBP family intramembrane glutamic endopeptidase [Arsukibacterium sp.]|uniref:CPBP family intramembrane glutamic endopeptidase n=1 Tax=Arsukibacterium sp. TaxID=1977258 RepID=UPI00299F042C|nr:CPBP family intramembrane glutamic endopeptidase [Arsukibacterium sp.]MDX1537512.1 CPBP family intramembrane glutamic endopeptidase [Arsukibacterium sp.]